MVREIEPGESHLAAAALIELRPHFQTVEALAARIDEQRANGYRSVVDLVGDEAAAVGGFRVLETTFAGRMLYVDDLVTRAAYRGKGHANRVFAWIEEEALRLGCDQLHLDSGVGPEREDAHRFYFNHGMRIASYHFARPLVSAG
ncbi:GNAT family N-acetyltransferase [Solirubrobacter phytolaccae]|uniref:GNAT family N-acetyltransferase n=1 Tax=Solirubrobacter phytolaccae TaxID=1404360 RepID=A0A9X3NAE0_9ACTN|nr:GNAT family N-acetyltransferase [Solirubrobacter phytolaccae]MDA0182818.1 GNAT family N-acetyltransferase [Solirubrobacter phytolaccae]